MGDRWGPVCQAWRPRAHHHMWTFNDTHMLMAFLKAEDTHSTHTFVDSMNAYLRCPQLLNLQILYYKSASTIIGYSSGQCLL